MASLKQSCAYGTATLDPASYFANIVAPGSADSWVLNLPPRLRMYQSEIEGLLGKVFSGRPRSADNIELAQQMTLNWCISKCQKIGINWDETWLGVGSN